MAAAMAAEAAAEMAMAEAALDIPDDALETVGLGLGLPAPPPR